ncbi:MAG: tetratricopeptide repeat protein, partial [Oscillochloris sp.]|nr:tetratricopeptide repeat protein [Oscillochloris sp.]
DQLRPLGPARPRPPRVYENLPAPTYSQFVMREQAFTEVLDGLQQRSAAVLIIGLGGNGKTSLAREVAAHCLRDDAETPRFDSVVWVSDKDRPGTTNLSTVLNEIARTLDYPGFTQFEHDEKRREVEQLLRRQRVLLVVDNFETITDGALLSWLLRLPEPSKALITSREYARAFRNNTFTFDLRGMSEREAAEFIAQRLHFLRIEKLVSEPGQLEQLIHVTGGNPKAIEISLGILKYERRSLQQAIDHIYSVRSELFDDLFTRTWSLLDDATQRVLLVVTFFPGSANSEALSMTAAVSGFTLDRAIDRLVDLGLLDVQQEDLNTIPRYALHPMVRAFVEGKLVERANFEVEARHRWLAWYADLATQVGFCWHDLRRLTLLDPEQETIVAVINWAYQHQMDAALVQITKGVSYYYYVRGLWTMQPPVDLIRAIAARKIGDYQEEILAISQLVPLLLRQGKDAEAKEYINEMQKLAQSIELRGDTAFTVLHALGLYALVQNQCAQAHDYWQACRTHMEEIATPFRILNQYWLAKSLSELGQVTEAKQLLLEGLTAALRHGYLQGAITIQTHLAALYLQEKNTQEAEDLLLRSKDLAVQYGDRTSIAEILRYCADLEFERGAFDVALELMQDVIDILERMVIPRQLQRAYEQRARIVAQL